MKNIAKFLSVGALALFSLSSCSDWVSPEALDYEPGGLTESDKGEDYYAALRAWKADRKLDENGIPQRPVTFGWFSDWTGVGSDMSTGQLMGLPDSVDFVSMWGNWHSLSAEKKEDLRKVQQIKGTKVLICFIVDDIGAQTTPKEVRDTWQEEGFYSEQEAVETFWGWKNGDEATYEPAIRKYARSILDTIRVYNWDGFDMDLECHYGSDGNIASYPDRISIFLDELSKELGPKSGTGKMLCVDGEPNHIKPEDILKLDYIISQAYEDIDYSDTDTGTPRMSSFVENFKSVYNEEQVARKTILCSNFESFGSTGGPDYTMRNGETTNQLNAFANYTYKGNPKARIGGIGAFRLVFDKNYKFLREAMTTLHSDEERKN